MKFRKKPVVVEAWCTNSVGEPPDWVIAASTCWMRENMMTRIMQVDTPNGRVDVNQGDWLIRGINGEVYPCASDVFVETYERVE